MDISIEDAHEEKGIEEYAELSKALRPPGCTSTSNISPSIPKQNIANLKKKALAEREEESDGRVKILNYTSEDSSVSINQKKLNTYFCAVCGSHCIITEVDIKELPQRTTDGSYALEEVTYFHKIYVEAGEKTLLRRTSGVEIIYKIKCTECGMPVGYRLSPMDEPSQYVFFYSDGLVSQQSDAAIYNDDEI